jgi:hypothetical protein
VHRAITPYSDAVGMRFLPPSTLIVCAAFPTFADETTGKIQAFDRFARIIVMTDKTVWQLAPTPRRPWN